MFMLAGVCVVCLLFLGGCSGTEIDLTVEIPPGKLECFWQHAPADTNVEVEYQVIDGGDLDINVMIIGPDNRVHYNELRKREDVTGFKSIGQGDYRICFDNTFSRISSKVVFFEVFVDDGKDDKDNKDDDGINFEEEGIMGQLDITVEEFLGILERSKKNLERTSQIQTLIKMHEAKDRNIQEANFFRVNFFSFLQLAIMISVGLVQVFMIRSLFVSKQPISGSSLKAKT
ncbi:hypothetical protein BsWGS_19059 [Bradybaena similaris]